MNSHRESIKAVRYAVCTALAAALVAGCAGNGGGVASAGTSGNSAARTDAASDKAVSAAERAVEKAPQDAALRIDLAHAYLNAGRFESASTTFEDAVALGDRSARTALAMALAYIGSSRNAEAVTVLDQWRDSIPASDYGLALALAGDTTRGVNILSDELRGGVDDAKLRQNLAYAYALDGRWREARLLAAQDLPADQLDARISEWALQGKPEDAPKRVAGLLGTTPGADAGQPAHLALSGAEGAAYAANDAAAPLAPIAFAAAGSGELPALGERAYASPPQPVHAEPATAPSVPGENVSAAQAEQFEQAFVAPGAPADRSMPGQESPVALAPAVARPAPRSEPLAMQSASAKVMPSAAVAQKLEPRDRAASTHLVQLGSFSSPENAKRAWAIYRAQNPGLEDHDLRVTEAVVRGRRYWRVAAEGFDRRSAGQMCSTVKGRGGGCIAYAESRPLPGAAPSPATNGPMRARR